MNMSLSILDLALIGATTGLTTLASMYLTMVFMKRLDRKRKLIVMEEIMSQMHDKAKTESQFEDIVNQLRDKKGSFDE
jgi:type IV secretory pathway VirB4 component